MIYYRAYTMAAFFFVMGFAWGFGVRRIMSDLKYGLLTLIRCEKDEL